MDTCVDQVRIFCSFLCLNTELLLVWTKSDFSPSLSHGQTLSCCLLPPVFSAWPTSHHLKVEKLGHSSSLFCKINFASLGKWKCFFQQTSKPKVKIGLRGRKGLRKTTWTQRSVDAQLYTPSLHPNTAKLLKMEENHQNFSQEPASAATETGFPLKHIKKREISKPTWKVRVSNKQGSSRCAAKAEGDP